MPTLLVVDDEPNVLYSLEKSLRAETLDILTAATAKQALAQVKADKPDAVLLDVRLPDMSGLDAFDRIREIDPRIPVVIITAHATTETAIEAMKRGAFEYLLKPVDLQLLQETVAAAIRVSHLSRVPAVFDQEDSPDASADRIVGLSPPMQQVYKDIGRVAPQDVNVLILGESGTGKELVARAIYTHSRRSRGPFLAINCAAIPEMLLESELFGHERGSFTGADRRRIGKLEQAHNGTLFLDEIGDMAAALQAKMLRVLQDGEFQRVGGNEVLHTDARVIAATNRNLEELIRSGQFREDLYYRLNVFAIRLPALRERREDIPPLIEHFVKLFGRDLGKPACTVPTETMEWLKACPWPGNVRELQGAIKYALVRATSDVLTTQCLPPSVHTGTIATDDAGESPPESAAVVLLVRRLLASGQTDIYRQAQQEFDRVVLAEVLRHTRGNQVLASQLLGISRTTLRAKLSSLERALPPHAFPLPSAED
jgi:nitrogen regulation protein NR(I)